MHHHHHSHHAKNFVTHLLLAPPHTHTTRPILHIVQCVMKMYCIFYFKAMVAHNRKKRKNIIVEFIFFLLMVRRDYIVY